MMSKKLFVGLASIAAIAAFAIAPAAQASDHWYVNNCKIGAAACPGPHVATLTYGTLKNVGNAAAGGSTIECKNVVGGWAGTTSNGLTQDFASYECTGNIPCGPGHEEAYPVQKTLNEGPEPYPNTGWPGEVEGSAAEPRVNTTGVKITLGCAEPPSWETVGVVFQTSPTAKQNPLGPFGESSGTSAGAPGETCFDAATGELEEETNAAAKGRTSGCLKTLGYNEQELIQLKSP